MADIQETAKTRGYWLAAELAELGGVNPSRIRQLLLAGELKGDKAGQTWIVPYADGVSWLAKRETSE